jgi:hypothetical protein
MWKKDGDRYYCKITENLYGVIQVSKNCNTWSLIVHTFSCDHELSSGATNTFKQAEADLFLAAKRYANSILEKISYKDEDYF